jgi:PAS domain S-box-containing protein
MNPAPSKTIKYRIVALVIFIIVPLIVVFSVVAMNLATANRKAIELQRLNSTRELSSAVDRDFVKLQGVLTGIAVSLEMRNETTVDFVGQLAAKAKFASIVRMWAFSKDGEATEQFASSPKSAANHALDDKLVARVFDGESVASTASGEGAGQATVVVAVPVFSENSVISGLAAEVSLSYFSRAFDDAGMKKNWVAAVVDHRGHFVARSLDNDKRAGTPARPELAVVANGPEPLGTFENVTLEGAPVLNSFLRSSLTGWTSVVAVPKSELEAPLQRALAYTLLGGLAALALSIFAARMMAARISGPVTNLSRYAAALASGQPAPPEKYRIREIDDVKSSLDEAMAQSARLAALVASSGDAIIRVDIDGTIQTWNRGAEQIFGYPADEIIGKPKSILVPEDEMQGFDAQRSQILAGETVRAESVRRKRDGGGIDVEFVDAPIFDPFGKITAYSTTIRDITERKASRDHRQLLMRELAHRTKNQLAIIQSIAQQTRRNATTLDGFLGGFVSRLHGLAASHDVLSRQEWRAVPLRELVRSQLSILVNATDENIAISGPDITLNAVAAEALGMALHELTTNSLKYGALSAAGGRVSISWTLNEEAGPTRVLLEWKESGGPKIKGAPERQGFGSKVINTTVAMSLGGKSRTEFEPEGLCWQVEWELKP